MLLRNILLALSTLLVVGMGGLSPSFLQLEKSYATAMATYDSLSLKEKEMMDAVGKYIEEKKSSSSSSSSSSSPLKREALVYADVDLANEEKFSLRQNSLVDIETLVSEFIRVNCLIPFCADLVAPLVEDLLPEVRIIQSLNAEATSNAASLDLLLHLLTFPGSVQTVNSLLDSYLGVKILPTTAVAYFTASADYTLSYNAANIDFSAQAFVLLQSYSRVIEFNDANNNDLYDAGEEVKTINLGAVGWSPSTLQTVSVGNKNVYHVSASTQDNVVTFDCDTSTFPVKDSFGQIISPNSTKCTISINNFPFSGTNSLLAIEADIVLIGGNFAGVADGVVTGSLNVQNTPTGIEGGQFTWVSKVQSGDKDFSVAAKVSGGASNGVVDLISDLTVSAAGSTSKDVKKVFFTFKTGANPANVVWDPSVIYGEPALESSASSASISFLGVATFALTLALLFAF